MDTYFWVNVKCLESTLRLGPYMGLAEAVEIMMERLGHLAPALGARDILAAYISEECLNGKEWIHIVEHNSKNYS